MSQVVTGRNPSDRGADTGPREEGAAAEGEGDPQLLQNSVGQKILQRRSRYFLLASIVNP